MEFEEPLKEYLRTIQSIKLVLADRAQAYKSYRELADAARLKELHLEKLRVVRADKVHNVEIEVKELLIQSDEAKTRFDAIVTTMQQEILRFQEEKTRDLGQVLHDFAQGQAQMSSEIADTWRALIPALGVTGNGDASKATLSS